MRIHAVQTGTVAIKQRQLQGAGRGMRRRLNTMLDHTWTNPLPIYLWVIEHPEGVIVVDTGETARAAEPGYFPRWHPYYRLGVREWVRPEEEVGPQLRAVGIPPEEVRWVVLTHLHSDHAGGLAHFPKADILLSRPEYQSAAGWRGQVRGYLPHRWPTWLAPMLIPFVPAAVGPFPMSYALTRAEDVLLVPTPGHTSGHLSVIVLEDGLAVFLAGDTSYSQQLMLDEAVDGVAPDEQVSRQTLRRIRAYTQQVPTVYLPSHDQDARVRLLHRQTVPRPALFGGAL
ncbi:MAG TPA: N-acyl homoserine lactonase family protein [Ktedonobacterales bacterium]|nr:N-acyl homoserine lactonase family protein [Ktedonobacterales bacterium]